MPSALLFDLGTVIIDIDPNRTRQAFSELLGEQYSDFLNGFPWQEMHRKLELGQISQEVFIHNIQSAAPVVLQAADIVQAWNATLIGIPPWRIELLKNLGKNYRLFLLSNTDPIHMDWIRAYAQRTFGLKCFEEEIFERSFFSYTTGMRKPDADIYHHVLQATGIPPSEFFFIDDLLENIEGARKVGIPGMQYPVNQS